MRILSACLITAFWGATAFCAVAPPPRGDHAEKHAYGAKHGAATVRPTVLQAPASTEKFFPDGLKVTMEPEDLWAIANLRYRQLPPVEYDHPVTDPVEVVDVPTETELRKLCGLVDAYKGSIVIGCAGPKGNTVAPDRCLVYLGPIPAWTGITRNINLRHELGHCNGWPADHSNPTKGATPAPAEGRPFI